MSPQFSAADIEKLIRKSDLDALAKKAQLQTSMSEIMADVRTVSEALKSGWKPPLDKSSGKFQVDASQTKMTYDDYRDLQRQAAADWKRKRDL